MQYSKKSKEFSIKFPIPLGFNVFAIQPNFITWGIVSKLYMLVMILLLKILYILEIFSIDSYQLLELDC